jgi:hypothetical protein
MSINIMSINIIDFVLLFLIVCLSVFLIYKNFIETKPTLLSIDAAIRGAGIEIPPTASLSEHFYANDVIVFDSPEKINKNFEKFIEIYLPSVDINLIKKLFKEDGIDKSIDDIINENNVQAHEMFENFILTIAMCIFAKNNKNNIILFGLFYFIMIKMEIQNDNIKYYYLNDYDIQKDFIIYSIPSTYTGDINKLSNDPTIKLESLNQYLNNKPFKISLNNIMKTIVLPALIKSENNNITEEEINKFLSILQKNNKKLQDYINCNIALQFSMIYYKGDVRIKNTKIFKLTLDIIDPKNYTPDIKTYFPFKKQTEDSLYDMLKLTPA